MTKRRKRAVSGETLVETLVGILIVTLCALLLAQTAATASRLNQTAQKEDSRFRRELETAERNLGDVEGTAVISDQSGHEVGVYSVRYSREEENALASYRLEETP